MSLMLFSSFFNVSSAANAVPATLQQSTTPLSLNGRIAFNNDLAGLNALYNVRTAFDVVFQRH